MKQGKLFLIKDENRLWNFKIEIVKKKSVITHFLFKLSLTGMIFFKRLLQSCHWQFSALLNLNEVSMQNGILPLGSFFKRPFLICFLVEHLKIFVNLFVSAYPMIKSKSCERRVRVGRSRRDVESQLRPGRSARRGFPRFHPIPRERSTLSSVRPSSCQRLAITGFERERTLQIQLWGCHTMGICVCVCECVM